MQTLHVRTNDQVMTKILTFIDDLSRKGDEIEVLDDQIYAYEKKYIDRALKDISEEKTYTLEEIEMELLDAG